MIFKRNRLLLKHNLSSFWAEDFDSLNMLSNNRKYRIVKVHDDVRIGRIVGDIWDFFDFSGFKTLMEASGTIARNSGEVRINLIVSAPISLEFVFMTSILLFTVVGISLLVNDPVIGILFLGVGKSFHLIILRIINKGL